MNNTVTPYFDYTTGLIEANWSTGISWPVPANALSGVYIAKLTDDSANHYASHLMLFVVQDGVLANGNLKNPYSVVVQIDDVNLQAYNEWGGNSLYERRDDSVARTEHFAAHTEKYSRSDAVSFNRPYGYIGQFLQWTQSVIPYVEQFGFDVTYASGQYLASQQSNANPTAGLGNDHAAVILAGHDEYWSGEQRAAYQHLIDNGTSMLFLGGNQGYWKTRWDNSGVTTDFRTMICFKESQLDTVRGANVKHIDPSDSWTGTWRDPAGADPVGGPIVKGGGIPENAIKGSLFIINGDGPSNNTGTADKRIEVPVWAQQNRFWRGINATDWIASNSTLNVTMGAEWDTDSHVEQFLKKRPDKLTYLSSTSVYLGRLIEPTGAQYSPLDTGAATHHLTLYTKTVGMKVAKIFSSGLLDWSLGMETPSAQPGAVDTRDPKIRQAMYNLLIDCDAARAGTLPGGITPTDNLGTNGEMTVTVSSTAGSAYVPVGGVGILTGTAGISVGNGKVAAVEVKLPGESYWRPAQGTDSWACTWLMPSNVLALSTYTVHVRAIDDRGIASTPFSYVLSVVADTNIIAK